MAKTDTLNQFAPALTLTVKAGAAAIPVGAPVYVKSYDPANLVVTVEQMFANNTATLSSAFGILVANLGTGGSTVAIGGACIVLLAGGCPITYSGLSPTPSVGDPLYVSDAGVVAVAPGTNTKQVGRVGSEDSGDVWMLVDGGLGGGGGGGSPTAQVLLQSADGAFPAGIDISALAARVAFTDTVGLIVPGAVGAPVTLRFDKGAAGAAGDIVALPMAMKNDDLPTPSWFGAGGIGWSIVSPTAGVETTQFVVSTVYLGSPVRVVFFDANKLTIPNVLSPAQPLEIETDYNLRIGTTAGPVTLDPAADVVLNANGAIVARTINDQEIWQPTNTTIFENRIPRRKATSTLNATPTVLDSWTPALSENYVICVETTVVGMDAAASMYITAKRVARFAYNFSGPTLTQLGSTYVPVPDDAAGGLAVDLTASGGSIAVIVTGDAATTIEWTAWTQFLITKIG